MRFLFALLLGLFTGSVLILGAGEIHNEWLSKGSWLIGLFAAGFVGMLAARQRPIVYALVLGVIPVSAIFVTLAVRNGDPVICILATNLKTILGIFLLVLAGSATAHYF